MILRIFILTNVFIIIIAIIDTCFGSTNSNDTVEFSMRNLGMASISVANAGKQKKRSKRDQLKASKTSGILKIINSKPLPRGCSPEEWSEPHNPKAKTVIFAAAMYEDLRTYQINYFAGTARKTGFDGDIVIAMDSNTWPQEVRRFQHYQTVVYNVSLSCSGDGHNKVCSMYNEQSKYSINMIRYYLYRWWAKNYSKNTLIMISDFRDVFFQSNPFLYKPEQWTPPVAQLVVFQEAHPNSVINRCKFNKGWIRTCYGEDALEKIGHNTVSCSGVSMGTRDAILVYSFLLTKQADPVMRNMQDATPKQKRRCISLGMDQGFHNWMIYSGMLNRYMDVRIFQQGEGPVNTLGGFYGKKKILQFSLEKWGILQGKAPHMFITNWNGDRSPVVHQLDRFKQDSPFYSTFKEVLDVMKGS